jgi:hypothetical protein
MDTVLVILEKLGLVILGFAIKFFIPGTFRDTSIYKSWRAGREYRKLREIFVESKDYVRVGSVRIDQITVLPFMHGLTSDKIRCKYEDKARKLPDPLQALEHDYLPYREAQLKELGRTVDPNDTYSLRQMRVERPQQKYKDGGDRINTIELVFEPSNFKYNLMINEALDKPLITSKGQKTTIRQVFCLDHFDWSEIPKIPFHLWFSTVVGVVTSDHQFVLAIRSGMQAIRDSDTDESAFRASMSCAEGMLRPVDIETNLPYEIPSPFITAKRALWRELGLSIEKDHYLLSDVKLISLCFDTFRYQPLAVFLLELKSLKFDEVHYHWTMAPDRHENIAVIPIPVKPYSFAELLHGEFKYEGLQVRLFSNHQQIGVLLTGCKLFGPNGMARALS